MVLLYIYSELNLKGQLENELQMTAACVCVYILEILPSKGTDDVRALWTLKIYYCLNLHNLKRCGRLQTVRVGH